MDLLNRQVRVGGDGAALFLGLILAPGDVLLLLRRGLGPVVHAGLLLPTVPELDGWKYCPRCRADLSQGDEGKVECPECGFFTYGSSKPTVGTLCLDDEGRVLLARRGAEPYLGRWDVPGGFLDEGEHPLDGLRREFREEGGVDVEPREFIGAWVDEYGEHGVATLNFYWTARIVGGELEPADDVAEFRWFALDEVPTDELAFNHVNEVLSAVRNEHS